MDQRGALSGAARNLTKLHGCPRETEHLSDLMRLCQAQWSAKLSIGRVSSNRRPGAAPFSRY